MQQLTITPVMNEKMIVDNLRNYVASAAVTQSITVKHVTIVVNSVIHGEPYSKLVKKMSTKLTGTDASITDIVAVLGTWLAHSLGKSDLVYPYAEDCGPGSVDGKRIPLGYAPTTTNKRDLAKALSAIIYHAPDTNTLERFVARTYTGSRREMSYSIVSGVWGLCTAERLHNVRLISADPVFLTQVIEAFDIMDVAREVAVNSVKSLTRESDVSDVLKQCDKANWLDEHNFNKLRASAEMQSVNEAGKQRFEYELESFVTRMEYNMKKYNPLKVADLTLAQVRKISLLAGLALEQANKAEETEIRKVLKDMNLDSDTDLLVPQALLCANKGNLDAFWAIMKSRINGNGSWLSDLSDLLES